MSVEVEEQQQILLYNHNINYFYRHDPLFRVQLLRIATFMKVALEYASKLKCRENQLRVWSLSEISNSIFSYLDARSLVSASEVCYGWYSTISESEEVLYRRLCIADFNVDPYSIVNVNVTEKRKEPLLAKNLYIKSSEKLGSITRLKSGVGGFGVTTVERSFLRL